MLFVQKRQKQIPFCFKKNKTPHREGETQKEKVEKSLVCASLTLFSTAPLWQMLFIVCYVELWGCFIKKKYLKLCFSLQCGLFTHIFVWEWKKKYLS